MQRRCPRGHRLTQNRGCRRQDLRRLLREAAGEDGEEGAEDAEAGGEDGRVCLERVVSMSGREGEGHEPSHAARA